MNRSLRMRLIIGIGACTALLLAGAGVLIYLLMQHAMTAEVDNSLSASAHLLMPLVEYDDGKVDLDLDRLPVDWPAARENLVELWGGDGAVVQRSPGLGGRDLPRLDDASGLLRIHEGALAEDQPLRVAQITFDVSRDPHDGGGSQPVTVTLAVARLTQPLDRQLSHLRMILLLSFTSLTAAAMLIVIAVVTRTLRPVHELGEQIAGIEHDNLAQRIAVARLPTELAPPVDRLNELLGRLEAAFERERHFTGDVAHELRTPLAGLRSILEVTASRPRSPDQYARALDDMNTALRGMEDMVSKLLMLARLDAAQVALDRQPFRLHDGVAAAWKPLANAAKHRQIQFKNDVTPDVSALADRDLLAMILTNMLHNAVQYTDIGGRISVDATIGSQHVTLTVTNTGCELNVDDAARVFDRFWRGDAARSDIHLHSGLGLSLVKRAATIMHGDAWVNITADQKFEVHIRLPRSV